MKLVFTKQFKGELFLFFLKKSKKIVSKLIFDCFCELLKDHI
jgi:hypothetical protein